MGEPCEECGGLGTEERPHERGCQTGAQALLDWFSKNLAPEFKFFVGPCAHGRDPWTRCDVCGELEPGDACRDAALEEAAKVAADCLDRGDVLHLDERIRALRRGGG